MLRREGSCHRDPTDGLRRAARSAEPVRQGRQTGVGRRQRHADVPRARRRRRSRPGATRMPRSARRRTVSQQRLVAGRPQVEPGLGVVDPEARARRRASRSTVPPAPRTAPAARRRARRRRAPHASPPAPGAARSSRRACGPRAGRAPARGSPATNAGAVSGEVGPLRQRVTASRPVVVAAADVGGARCWDRSRRPSRARRSTRRWRRRRRAREPRRRPSPGAPPPRTRPVGCDGELSQTRRTRLAAGPSWAVPSAGTGVAPASRAPTS